MDEGDEYVPQMSQMTDYGMPPMGPPMQQHYQQMPNPYNQQQQQQMMMMQQHQMAMAPHQVQPPPQQAAPAKKPRAKSKKAQAAAAAAAAAAAQEMDPMASMAAMSNNPMMRQGGFPQNQMGMYGGHYPGGSGQQGYRPVPSGAAPGQPQSSAPQQQQPPPPQSQGYPPYPPQMYQQRAPGPPTGAYPQYGYPPGSGSYPSSQYPPPQQMRSQYPQPGQHGYWEQPQYPPGSGGYGANVPPNTAPTASGGPQAPDQWGMGPQQQHQQQQTADHLKSKLYSIDSEIQKIQQRMGQLYHQPRNPMIDQEMNQLNYRLQLLQRDQYMLQQQLSRQNYAMASASSQSSSVVQAGIPSQKTQQPQPNPATPVQVNQSGNQVQLNITADKSRTLISVYHEGYGGPTQLGTSGMVSGASSTESKESVVPPEPTPTTMQNSIKAEPVTSSTYGNPPGYGGMDNGVTSATPSNAPPPTENSQDYYSRQSMSNASYPSSSQHLQSQPSTVPTSQQQQEQQVYGQYPHHQIPSNYPSQMNQQYPMQHPNSSANGSSQMRAAVASHMSVPTTSAYPSSYPDYSKPSIPYEQSNESLSTQEVASSSQIDSVSNIKQEDSQTSVDYKPPIDTLSETPGDSNQAAVPQDYEERATNEEISRIMKDESLNDSEERDVSTPSITREEIQAPADEESTLSNGAETSRQENGDYQEQKETIIENDTSYEVTTEQSVSSEIPSTTVEEPVTEDVVTDQVTEDVVERDNETAYIQENQELPNEDEQVQHQNEEHFVEETEELVQNDQVEAEEQTSETVVEESREIEKEPEENVEENEDEEVENNAVAEENNKEDEEDNEDVEEGNEDVEERNEDVEEEINEDLEEENEEPEEEAETETVEVNNDAENEDVEADDNSSGNTKEGSEEPTPSEFTEPSTPATPSAVSSTVASASTTKKRNYKRPIIIAKAKKKKSADSDNDDDFYPEKGRGRKKGGGRKKKGEDGDEVVGEANESFMKRAASGKSALNAANDDDDDDEDMLMRVESTAAVDPDAMIVEKILNSRMFKEDGEEEEKEQFLIKWKGRAYVHCEWKTGPELEELDKRSVAKVKRFKVKKSMERIEDDEDFNSDYVIVDRVVDVTKEEDGQEFALIKWKALGYEEVTWEAIETVPEDKVEVWRKRQIIDPAKLKEKPRPEGSEWKKIETETTWKDGNSLREYQFEGVNWLLYCWYNSQNCILADEMGLGKTVQTITFLSQIYEYGIHGPYLIVVPLSTIHNWVREFETWTDMNAVVYHGNAYSREVLQQYEIFYDKKHSGSKNWKKNLVKLDALITTFEMVVTDCEFIRKIPWRVCVIDEAHRLKNRNCKLLVNGLLAFKMEHRVLLTGTPLQNNIEELFSLLNFLHPQQFNSSTDFLQEFGQCQSEDQVQKLQDILRPMMLRRLKEDVEKSLGPKEETIIEVQLSDMQKKFYRAILERNFTHLCKGPAAPSLMNIMMELRKCCNHPFLINGAEETILNDFKMMHPEWDEETLATKALVQASGKVVLIEKLLPKLRKDGHKVLIFSQMVKVLDLLEEFLVNMNYPFERIDGNVRGDLRQASIDRFSRQKSDRFVFLLCTRAGGLGINLTAADTVIIFDSDWNPQNDLQAQARCHRIGQKKLVKVYRLITANTYEREMFDKASLKLGLDKAVLQSTTALKNNELSKKEVEELLKKGAYGSIMDENNESAKFNEEDIETILQRRTQTITLEAGQKGSLFAKATFNSTHNKGDDIDIDDPEFWTKWAEKAQVDIEKATATPDGRELIIEEPRKRTKRFEDNMKDEEESDGSEEDGKRKRNGTDRANRKRRRDEDGDYSGNYRPDELATSKTEYFKVEKVLAQFGWGRWTEMKRVGDFELNELDIEHMSRTLLLHCVREFRGEDRIRQFVFQLIKPEGAKTPSAEGVAGGVSKQNIYHLGWASLPEFNPPSFALDSSFQRHVHRHANKLMIKIDMLKHLETYIVASSKAAVEDLEVKWTDIELKEVPAVSETVVDGWDADCDKCLLIGSWRHGLENYDNIKNDENLCFSHKEPFNWPAAADLWLRFRRLVGTSQRNIHDPVYERLRWSKREEQEFMRVLRSFGIKDSKNDPTTIDWESFKALAPVLEKKKDDELQEQLFCVLAMCTKMQGGELQPMDMKRAMSVEALSAKRATKLMNRLHLTRKIHSLALNIESLDLKLCAMDAMPSGWTTQHDKELLEICDQCGLEGLATNCLKKPAFEKIVRPSERTLLRRIIEIVNTIESGRWMGAGDVDTIEDEDSEEKVLQAAVQAQALRLQQQQQQAQAAAAAAARRGRKRGATAGTSDDAKMKAVMQQLMLAGAGSTANSNEAQAMAMIQALVMMNMQQQQQQSAVAAAAAASSSQKQQQQQQQQQNATLQMLSLLMAGVPSTSAASTSKASSSSASAALAQAAAASSSDPLSIQQQMALAELFAQAAGLPTTPTTTSKKPKISTAATPTASTSKESAPSTSSAALPEGTTKIVAVTQETAVPFTSQDQIIQALSTAGVGMGELIVLNSLPKETPIPMMHRKTKEAIPAADRPTVIDMSSWVVLNPDYIIDLNNQGKKPKVTPPTPTTNAVEESSSAKPSEPSTPAPAMTPKPTSPVEEGKKTASATANVKIGSSLQIDDPVAVFNKKNGELLPASKWPKAKDLASWLESNSEYNVHSSSSLIAQIVLGAKFGDRIGGEPSASTTTQPTTLPSTTGTPAPPLTPSTPASMSNAANAQLVALTAAAAAAASVPSTPTTSSKKNTAQHNAAEAAKQQMEMLQLMCLQSAMMTPAAAAYPMMFQYMMPNTSGATAVDQMAAAAMAAAAAASSTPTSSKNNTTSSSNNAAAAAATAAAATAAAAAALTATSTPSTSTAAAKSSASDDAMNPMLMQALMTNPALLQSLMLSDPTSAALLMASIGGQQQQQQHQQQLSSKKSKH